MSGEERSQTSMTFPGQPERSIGDKTSPEVGFARRGSNQRPSQTFDLGTLDKRVVDVASGHRRPPGDRCQLDSSSWKSSLQK